MAIKPEHLDELLSGYEKPEDLLGEDGLFKQLKKALLERALGAELTHHLGYEKGDPAGRGTGNSRNGSYPKTVLTEDGAVDIEVPRDRNSTFEPQIVPKGETRLDGFDDKIISLYARGMTVREIQGHLRELYAVDVSPDLISRVTDAVLDEVREWQNRPLDAVYPVVFFDALRVKIRDESVVRNKAVYPGPGARLRGPQARPGPVDRAERGRQVLAAGHERAQEPWRRRHPVRGGRRPQGLPRRHNRHLPAHHRADLHRPPDPP
jgi:transposase-like protein